MGTATETREELESHAVVLRALIRQENDVTNHRTTWLLVAQGILFAAAAAFLKVNWFPALVVGGVGILVALSIGHALRNSYESRLYLKRKWRERLQASGFKWEDFPPLDGGNPELKTINWLFPWTFLPWVIGIAWVLLIGYAIAARLCAT